MQRVVIEGKVFDLSLDAEGNLVSTEVIVETMKPMTFKDAQPIIRPQQKIWVQCEFIEVDDEGDFKVLISDTTRSAWGSSSTLMMFSEAE